MKKLYVIAFVWYMVARLAALCIIHGGWGSYNVVDIGVNIVINIALTIWCYSKSRDLIGMNLMLLVLNTAFCVIPVFMGNISIIIFGGGFVIWIIGLFFVNLFVSYLCEGYYILRDKIKRKKMSKKMQG